MLNRREFFGAAAAVMAGPEIVSEAVQPTASRVLSLSMDMSGVSKSMELAISQATELSAMTSALRPFDFGNSREYVYRTGYPEIDALRSISGVYRKHMEMRRG